jgi:hypothetical protein
MLYIYYYTLFSTQVGSLYFNFKQHVNTKAMSKKRRKYSVDEVIRDLAKKGVAVFSDNRKSIFIHKAKDLGNKSFGKIDFLVRHNGYTVADYAEYKKSRIAADSSNSKGDSSDATKELIKKVVEKPHLDILSFKKLPY